MRSPVRRHGPAALLRLAMRPVVAAGLAADAAVHAALAPLYDPVRAGISEGSLFRIEAGVACAAAAAFAAGGLLLEVRQRWTAQVRAAGA